jgi:hypothetical protein
MLPFKWHIVSQYSGYENSKKNPGGCRDNVEDHNAKSGGPLDTLNCNAAFGPKYYFSINSASYKT